MRLLSSLALLGALCACKGDKPPAPAKPAEVTEPVAKPVVPEPTGSIEGVVVLAEGAELPVLPDPRISAKLALIEPPAPCTPIGPEDLSPVKRDVEGGGLSWIHLALTGMEKPPTHPPRVHELRLENCRLDTPLVAAQPGDSVRITNASQVPLLPGIVGDALLEAILAGASRTIVLKRPGAPRIACTFGSYCGQTDVLLTAHSLVAVSDKLGHYRIDNVPLNQDLTLHAWHPLFEESHEAFRLTEAAPTHTFTIKLKPAASSAQAKPAEPAPAPGQPADVLVH